MGAESMGENMGMSRAIRLRRSWLGMLVCLSVWALQLAGQPAREASACQTPVYRYALYNWGVSPFQFYYIYRGKTDSPEQAVCQKLREASEASPAANTSVETVDLEHQDLQSLPEPLRAVIQAESKGSLPTFVAMAPWQRAMPVGRLKPDDVAGLVDSPARQRLGSLLDQGRSAIFLLVPGVDVAGSHRAEEVIQQCIAQGAAGEIPVETVAGGPTTPDGRQLLPPSKTSAASPNPNRLDLALVKVDRNDPKEKWLIRMLMLIEPDLNQYTAEPMVFAVYGRGRAMEPYIGKGITLENLRKLISFLAGDCSCFVKDENPGVDLLMRWDWKKTADRLAASDPTVTKEDGEDQNPAADIAALVPTTSKPTLTPASASSLANNAPASVAPVEKTTTDAVPGRQGVSKPTAGAEARVAQSNPPQAESGSAAERQIWRLAMVLAGIAIVTVGVGTVLVQWRGQRR